MKIEQPRTKAPRPAVVTLVGALILVVSTVNLAIALLGLTSIDLFAGQPAVSYMQNGALTDRAQILIASIFTFGIEIAFLITGIALLRMRRWAWSVEMALTGLILLLQLIQFFDGNPDYVSMLTNMLIAFALNQQVVQEAFGIRRRRDAQST